MNILKLIQKVGAPQRSIITLRDRLAKAGEELGELAEAILHHTSETNPKAKTHDDIVEEAVDLAIMAMDIALTKPVVGDLTNKEARQRVEALFEEKAGRKWAIQVEEDRTVIYQATLEAITHREMKALMTRRLSERNA